MSSVINDTLLAIKAVFEAGALSAQLPSSLGIKTPANSLAVTATYGSFGVPEVIAGRACKITASVAAVAGQFGRIQIANPVGSGVDITIAGLTTWAGTAGTHTYSVYEIPIANVGTLIPSVQTNYKIGSAVSAALVYYANSATAIPTTGLVASGAHANIIATGTSLIYPGGNIAIPEGKCIEIAIGTANVASNVNMSFYFTPNT